MFIPRTLAETSMGPGRAALARAVLIALMLAAALFGVLSFSFTPGQISLEVNDVARQEIRAPTTVTFTSQSQTEAARNAAAATVEKVYEPIGDPAAIRMQQLREFDSAVGEVSGLLASRDARRLTAEKLKSELNAALPDRSDAQIALIAAVPLQTWKALTAEARRVLDSVLVGEIRAEAVSDVRQRVRQAISTDLPANQRELAGDLAAGYVRENSQYSESATQAAEQRARNRVAPVEVTVIAGTAVVREGDPITVQTLEELEALGLTRPRASFARTAGLGVIAILVSALLVAFLWRFQPAIWYRNRSLLLFLMALVATAIAMRVGADRTLWTYVVPTSAAVLLVGILLEGGAGAALAVVLAVLAGVMNADGLEPAVFVLAGGLASLVAIVRAERLNGFVRAGASLALTNIGVVIAFSLLAQGDAAAIAQLAGAGVVNAGLSVFLAVGSFAMLGHLFGIMTVFQLLELANPSNRLLRRLLLETPGTYHHSVMVGNLAERAAETIGADPLLARVAAYYHDIGKMKNPLAFIENQAGSRNVHDDLSAETSARIIAGHVRDGIDLAYEHGLPVQITGFIPQHHGTSLMSYFWDRALQDVGGNEELIDQAVFRYPGPKPQSREAAILMLSDGVEASVRSLDEKDERSIRAMVDRIVDARLEDGQLDDADLTLKNIAQIKEAFVQQLLGMYHQRIKYPDNVVPLERREEA
ncbi:MAG: HDIG domain-containing metalloprotein [Chloroflexota bacterium]